jgi:hypothetical protein
MNRFEKSIYLEGIKECRNIVGIKYTNYIGDTTVKSGSMHRNV